MDTRTRMLSLLHTRRRNYSLPQPFYNDAEFFALDLEYIFRRQWLFAGLACEIPKPGHYFTMEVGPDSLIIVRDRELRIHALYNTCRHRGSRICLSERGASAKLVCPYHQWTYELDGRLLFAGNMGEDFDPRRFHLKRAHCEVIAGYIFVCLAEEAPDFEDFRRTVAPYMAPHDLDNCKVAFESTLIEQANWKLVIENNRECYHCAGSHPELLNTLSEFDSTDDPRVDPAFAQRIEQKARDWDALGLPNRVIHAPDNRYRVVRLPFAHGVSMTLDGQPGCNRLLGQLRDRDLGSLRLLSLPNSWNHLQSDHALAFRVLPIGPQQTAVTTKWLVHKDAVEGVDYDVERLTRVWLATNEQDRKLAEDNQRGINSKAYEPGPYSPAIEFGVQNFIDWYSSEMLRQLSGETERMRVVA
ncbi:MAG TPA: aromatic ring-hydroxylating dioxygenase subunit alpha [Candidatus Competibacteraceae bacterium]|nr:aromatic ring-hydroxylating dioxygenase subunit alpha [Candidatus Competibacteraceae bacterium]